MTDQPQDVAKYAMTSGAEVPIAGYWAVCKPSTSGKTAAYVVQPQGYHMVVAYRALCTDGKVRTVRVNQSPDTYFSHSGRATFGKETKRGYVHMKDDEYHFTVYYRRTGE